MKDESEASTAFTSSFILPLSLFPLRLRLAYACAHFADCFGESREDCAGDDVVAYVELGDFVDGRDVQAVLRGERRGLSQSFQLRGGARAPLGVYRARAECRLGVGGRAQL